MSLCKNLIKASVLLTPLAFAAPVSADCGRITVADMNWASATFAAYLDKFILEEGFGCDVEVVPGDTAPTLASMIAKGQPDIAPELWENANRVAIKKGVDEGKLVVAAKILLDGGEEGWWVPDYVVKQHPELTTVDAVLARPDLFPHPEDDSKGGFVTCPSGWGCQHANENLSRANEFAKHGFELVDPGSAAGLDGSIAKAFERGENWFGYYWAPTSILGKYPMVKLDFGVPYDGENWDNCIVNEDCPNPKRSSWTKSEVSTLIHGDFARTAPAAVMAYLGKREYKNSMLNGILAWMADEQATGEDSAEYFLENHEDLWTQWVPADVAEKIKAAL